MSDPFTPGPMVSLHPPTASIECPVIPLWKTFPLTKVQDLLEAEEKES